MNLLLEEKKKANKEEVTTQKRKKAVIAVELTDNNKVKRVYIKSIDNYSAKSLTSIFEEYIRIRAVKRNV
jgi:hypothetical protein